MDRPVFIIGVPRSGTTLLRYMINSSEAVYVPGESHFIPRFFGRNPRGSLSRDDVDRITRAMRDDYPLFLRKWQGPELTGEWLWRHMAEPTPSALLDAVYSEYARQRGACRWGDKTPIYTNHMLLIDELFPDAQFVHLVRDARDVALSTDEKWGDRTHVDIYYAAINWSQRTRNVEVAAHLLGESRVHTLRFEDLVADPPAELQRICRFLAIDYDQRMAQPHLLGRKELRRKSFSAKVRTPPDASNQSKWKGAMPTRDIRLVQEVAGDVLRRYGYELADLGPPSKTDRLRLRALAAKYATLQSGRRVLQSTGLKHPN